MSLCLHHLQRSLSVLATQASLVCVETKAELITILENSEAHHCKFLDSDSVSCIRKGGEDHPKFKLIALQYKHHHSD